MLASLISFIFLYLRATAQTCAAGRFLDTTIAIPSCFPCSTDLYSVGGATSCNFTYTTCPSGTYARPLAACNSCPPGSHNAFEGATSLASCVFCPAGSYLPSGTSIPPCVLCPPGTFNLQEGSFVKSACASCPAGSFSAFSGSVTCKLCPPGKWSNRVGSNSSLNCLPACPSGKYSLVVGSISETANCLFCPPGTFSNPGTPYFCHNCAPGSFSFSGASVQLVVARCAHSH